MKAGIIGIGTMGKQIASVLHQKGRLAGVFDLDESSYLSCPWMKGFQRSLPGLAEISDYLLLCLPDQAASIDTICTILSGHYLPRYIFDLTTATPTSAKINYQKCTAAGIKYFEVPMIGGVRAIARGNLKLIVGCDKEDAAIASELLGVISPELIFTDVGGSATTIKLIHNMVTIGTSVINMEALVLSDKLGIDRELMFEVLQKGTASSYVILNTLDRTLLKNNFGEGYKTKHVVKDAHSIMDLIESGDLTLGCFQAVYNMLLDSANKLNAETDYPVIYSNIKAKSEKYEKRHH